MKKRLRNELCTPRARAQFRHLRSGPLARLANMEEPSAIAEEAKDATTKTALIADLIRGWHWASGCRQTTSAMLILALWSRIEQICRRQESYWQGASDELLGMVVEDLIAQVAQVLPFDEPAPYLVNALLLTIERRLIKRHQRNVRRRAVHGNPDKWIVGPSPSAVMIHRFELTQTIQTLGHLAAEDRIDLLIAYYRLDRNSAELAATMGLPRSDVLWLVRRALRCLQMRFRRKATREPTRIRPNAPRELQLKGESKTL